MSCAARPTRAPGIKSVFAFPGTYIPGKDFTLKAGVVIRGEKSDGMLCSAAELELSNDHDGIIELPADAPVGVPYVEYAKLGNTVIDISITPNRGDATGVYGVARDLAAFGLGTLKQTDMSPVPSKGPSPIPPLPHNFAAGEPKAIRKFAGRYFKGIKNGPSPEWLQQRLRAVGLRPINAVVDIANLVSLGWGRPLHAYDADKIVGQAVLRVAKPRRRVRCARQQGLRARRDHDRHRRRLWPALPRRRHGRHPFGHHRSDGERLDGMRQLGPRPHRPDRPQDRHRVRCALSPRALGRSGAHRARPRARHKADAGAGRRRSHGAGDLGRGRVPQHRRRFPALGSRAPHRPRDQRA